MVGIVLVSHSHSLAVATRDLALGVSGTKASIAVAAGTGDDHSGFGTNAVEIMEGIQSVMSDEGVIVLMDMGSAILSTEAALGFLDDSVRAKVRCTAAPFVEGAVIASVTVGLGSNLEEVARETETALGQKTNHLQPQSNQASKVASPPPVAAEAQTVRLTVRNPHGLHARPAARFIREAAAQKSEITVRNLSNSRGPVSARSLSGLASLEILQGNEIEISAAGSDAGSALRVLKEAVDSGLGDSLQTAAPSRAKSLERKRGNAPISVSSGLAIGPLYFSSITEITVPDSLTEDPAGEVRKLRGAIDEAKANLAREEVALKASLGKAEAEIFQAQALVLDDPELVAAAEISIQNNRLTAAAAWRREIRRIIANYDKLADDYLRQRAADVRDIGARVLEALGISRPRIGDLPGPGVLVVEDLTPAEVTALPAAVVGVVCLQGGTTSHAAILLRARGIPAIAQAQAAIDTSELRPNAGRQTVAAFDGDTGELWIGPDAAKVKELRELKETRRLLAEEESEHRNEPAVTMDGHTVAIFANLGRAGDAANALAQGAEGVGLFRTEFLFLDRASAPAEDEQYATLRSLRETMGMRPVVIRTLDIGGDKEVPYLGLTREANPFLGVRGIRLCLQRRDLFETHLRAILRAAHGGNFSVMFPMISECGELVEAKAILDGVHRALERQAVPHAWPVPVGIMVEVPSAAMLADQLAPAADFFSIGTNDLTQYTLAADRGNAELSDFHDALHPAVLRSIRQIVAAAHRHRRPAAVCGEAGGDPVAARVLVGLGVDELSLGPMRIPAIKASIRAAWKTDLEILAELATRLASAADVRAMAG